MNFEEDFRTALLTDEVKGRIGERMSWGEVPQAQPRPLVVLWDITGTPDYTMTGPSGLENRHVQIDAWGEDYASAKEVSRAIVRALALVKGVVGVTEFQGAFVINERDSNDAGEGTDTASRHYCAQVDAMAWFSSV